VCQNNVPNLNYVLILGTIIYIRSQIAKRLRQRLSDIEGNLLRQVAEGNESAFSELFHACRDKLYSFTLRICGSPQQAEDIVQDIFLKVWVMRAELLEIKDFQQYLFRMSHNHAINLLKKEARESILLSKIRIPSSLSVTEQEVQRRETEAFVRNAIDRLPRQQKQVFILSREQGLNQEEISEKLHITIPTVKSHMTQALRSLRSRCKSLYPIVKSMIILVLTFLLKKSF
jgi:RNA polymerase sigma-70 factor (family 1)